MSDTTTGSRFISKVIQQSSPRWSGKSYNLRFNIDSRGYSCLRDDKVEYKIMGDVRLWKL